MLKPLKQAVKAALEALRRRSSARRLEQNVRHVTRTELAADLARLGVARGDTLFIHSSLKSLGFVEGGAAAVVGALQDAVGPEGTLLLPTYYMPAGTVRGTCEVPGYMFDPRKHGTVMGRLPEAFLAADGVRRSIHPTHSVSAWGRHAVYLTEGHHQAPSIFGPGSPWQRFLEIEHAKVLGLGISMGPVTFYHVLEDSMGAAFPVRIWDDTTFRLPCLDHAGKRWEIPVRPFLAAVPGSRIDHPSRADLRDYFQQEFERAGLRANGRVGDASAWLIPGQAFYAHLKQLSTENITIYSSPEQLAARPLA
jgi:aminoglycoside 3-N-acetyltransferase